jgi:hypothetical protein
VDTENPWEILGNPGMKDAFHGKIMENMRESSK